MSKFSQVLFLVIVATVILDCVKMLKGQPTFAASPSCVIVVSNTTPPIYSCVPVSQLIPPTTVTTTGPTPTPRVNCNPATGGFYIQLSDGTCSPVQFLGPVSIASVYRQDGIIANLVGDNYAVVPRPDFSRFCNPNSDNQCQGK